MNNAFRLGVVINPYAGIGGSVGLKGSDGADIRDKALAMGAEKLANQKMARALSVVQNAGGFTVLTAGGEMGEDCCKQLNLPV
ncbi:MAG: ATP-NAD kinase, partial [Pseudomonadota bacterium]|nr:ATP-NAD kinase [Pseudomonadota bacterium]